MDKPLPRMSQELVASDAMRAICRMMQFEPGALLRQKGQFYRDMYLLVDGRLDVDLETDGSPAIPVTDAGTPIGEIGFLRGSAATATVTARTGASALVIDNDALARLEREAPAIAASLMRSLADTAEERTSYNLTFLRERTADRGARSIEILICRDKALLQRAQRLRYDVYVAELHRNSPFADHGLKIISDGLDDFGTTFIAVEQDEVIGTLRSNLSWEGPLGVIEELYGMKASRHHPHATGICTKFIVKRARRGSSAASKLIAAMVQFGLRSSVKECYIDCIPALLPYYKAVGFAVSGPKFMHRENGPSIPMRLDLEKHGETLSRERGVRDDFRIYIKANAIGLMDRLRQRGADLLAKFGGGS